VAYLLNHKYGRLEDKITHSERNVWQAFRLVVHAFLGKIINETRHEFVENLIELYVILGCRKSARSAVIVEFLRPDTYEVSEEHVRGFHQDTDAMEKR
jgi:hypothetical protein